MFRGIEFQSFLVSLAYAEKAAAKQCLLISKHFEATDRLELSKLYNDFAQEEVSHFERIAALCENMDHKLSARAIEVYTTGFMNEGCSIVERLISVHLVFEPSALAFLGYVAKNIMRMDSSSEVSDRVRTTFRSILREEIGHVYSGSKLIRSLISNLTDAEKRSISRTVRKQRYFLRAGIRAFFNDHPQIINEMVNRYDFYFKKQIKGVLNERLEIVA